MEILKRIATILAFFVVAEAILFGIFLIPFFLLTNG